MKVIAVTGSKFASFGPYVPAVSGDRTLFYAKRAGTGDDAIFASNADGSEECLLATGAVSHPVADDERWAVFAEAGDDRFLVIDGQSTSSVAGPLGPTSGKARGGSRRSLPTEPAPARPAGTASPLCGPEARSPIRLAGRRQMRSKCSNFLGLPCTACSLAPHVAR